MSNKKLCFYFHWCIKYNYWVVLFPSTDSRYFPHCTDGLYPPQGNLYFLPSTDNLYFHPSADSSYFYPSADSSYFYPSADSSNFLPQYNLYPPPVLTAYIFRQVCTFLLQYCLVIYSLRPVLITYIFTPVLTTHVISTVQLISPQHLQSIFSHRCWQLIFLPQYSLYYPLPQYWQHIFFAQ